MQMIIILCPQTLIHSLDTALQQHVYIPTRRRELRAVDGLYVCVPRVLFDGRLPSDSRHFHRICVNE